METLSSDQKLNKRFDDVAKSATFKNIVDEYQMDKAAVLDVGCGFGEHLSFFGAGSVGVTTKDEEVGFGRVKNLAIIKGNAEKINEIGLNKKFSIIWANNLLEHILSPHAFLVKIKAVSKDNSLLVLGVPVVPKITSLVRLRKFRGVLADSHVNFFSKEALELTVSAAGWRVESIRPFLFSNKKLDSLFSCVAPHLYVTARNDVGFFYSDKKMKEWRGEKQYEELFDILRQHD